MAYVLRDRYRQMSSLNEEAGTKRDMVLNEDDLRYLEKEGRYYGDEGHNDRRDIISL